MLLLKLRFVINFPTVSAGSTLTKSCREERRTFRRRSLTVHRNVVWVYCAKDVFFSVLPLNLSQETNQTILLSSPCPSWKWITQTAALLHRSEFGQIYHWIYLVFSPSKYNLMRYLWMVFPDVMKKTLNQRQQTTDDEYAWNLTTRI